MRSTLDAKLLILLILCSLCSCSTHDNCEPREDTKVVKLLLKTVQDNSADLDRRVSAVRKLGELKANNAVTTLLNLLPGEWDLLTLEAIYALGRIGDSRALPKLKSLNGNASATGKIATALIWSIEAIEKGQGRRLRNGTTEQ